MRTRFVIAAPFDVERAPGYGVVPRLETREPRILQRDFQHRAPIERDDPGAGHRFADRDSEYAVAGGHIVVDKAVGRDVAQCGLLPLGTTPTADGKCRWNVQMECSGGDTRAGLLIENVDHRRVDGQADLVSRVDDR